MKVMNVFLRNFQTPRITSRTKFSGKSKEKYLQIFLKIRDLSKEIRQRLDGHTAFFSMAVLLVSFRLLFFLDPVLSSLFCSSISGHNFSEHSIAPVPRTDLQTEALKFALILEFLNHFCAKFLENLKI